MRQSNVATIEVGVDFFDADVAELPLLAEINAVLSAELGMLNFFMGFSPSRLTLQVVVWLVSLPAEKGCQKQCIESITHGKPPPALKPV
jgi:hypothetical protein